jgi:hypothetical protein
MKKGVLEAGDRSSAQVKRNIKRLERQMAAAGLTGEKGIAEKLDPLDYEAYMSLQLQAHKDNLAEMEMTDEEFEQWLEDTYEDSIARTGEVK